MKRLCIYVTYDCENTADDYIGCVLQELRKVVDCLAVVCNYQHIAHGAENIQPYADRLFYRENTGFDAGAYKDALCQYLGWDEICGYDEVLLVNDSFYGPLYPFGDMFDRMEGIDADYWGITKSPEVELSDGHTYNPHIQSYFLALRRNVLLDREFRAFWESMAYPLSLTQAVVMFEIGINEFLQKHEFVGATMMELMCPIWRNMAKNENPYMSYPLELIRDAGIPVLKRKSLDMANKRFGDSIKALEFIKNNCFYDVHLIESHMRRIGGDASIMGLDGFYANHPRIFIYGAGLYGRNVAGYFRYKGWTFENFLVTGQEDRPEKCISFEEADIAWDDGIIIAVGSKKAFLEIISLVKTRCREDQIFNPRDIIC